jgi:hypothetical protein
VRTPDRLCVALGSALLAAGIALLAASWIQQGPNWDSWVATVIDHEKLLAKGANDSIAPAGQRSLGVLGCLIGAGTLGWGLTGRRCPAELQSTAPTGL